ncbi:bidirectional sugar transporter n3 [Phtheirospermum japonicum]|uniref:Bidirectional sugar transporter SWEET n=1 Tax=Phtheirospermum japonicum TaxID=374723 RepID=A0A830BYS8_9LAMI|nr:bidirectional sugar transporter n3 [Phtheirospermum japonicum]
MPTFIRICKEKSTMGFDILPYAVALFSAMLWMYYALLKTNAILLISINSFGCIIETIYIVIYLFYASKKARSHAGKLLSLINVGLLSMIFVLSFFIFHGGARVEVVGWICVAVSVSVFAAPLSIVFQVVRTRSVEFMPLPLSFFLTLSAVMWFAYGLFQRDLCIALPNVLGFFLGVLQMLLYGIFRNMKPSEEIDEDKKMGEHAVDCGDKIEVLSTQQDYQVAAAVPRENNNCVPCAIGVEPSLQNCVPCAVGVEPSLVNLHLESPVLVVCAA